MLTKFYIMVSVYLAALKNEEGQGMAEYALIIAIVAVLLIAGLAGLRGGIEGALSDIVSGLGG
jgi:pilus assembly protein Flp/PilA